MSPSSFLLLYCASRDASCDVVKQLVACGASSTIERVRGVAGGTSILQNVKHLIFLKLLDENVRDPQADGATPLFVASWNGHADVLRTLFHAGADVNKAMVRCSMVLCK